MDQGKACSFKILVLGGVFPMWLGPSLDFPNGFCEAIFDVTEVLLGSKSVEAAMTKLLMRKEKGRLTTECFFGDLPKRGLVFVPGFPQPN